MQSAEKDWELLREAVNFCGASGGNGTEPVQTLFLDTAGVSGRFKNVAIAPGVELHLVDLHTRAPFCFRFSARVPHTAEIGFTMSGQVEFFLKGKRRSYDNFPGQGYLSFAEGEFRPEVRVRPGEHVQIIEVQFSPESFDDYRSSAGCALPAVLRPLADSCRDSVTKCPCMLPRHLNETLGRFFHSARECHAPSLLLEEDFAALSRALMLRLEEGMGSAKTVLSGRDLDRIRQAGEILSRRMADPPGLYELSRLVGLNDYKLKRGFRQAYGTTVHGALTELRLRRARQLLEERGRSVSEVALSVGYGNLGDFGIAFKKRYGTPPSRWAPPGLPQGVLRPVLS